MHNYLLRKSKDCAQPKALQSIPIHIRSKPLGSHRALSEATPLTTLLLLLMCICSPYYECLYKAIQPRGLQTTESETKQVRVDIYANNGALLSVVIKHMYEILKRYGCKISTPFLPS